MQTALLIVQTTLVIVQTALVIELYYAIPQRLSILLQSFINEIAGFLPDDVFSPKNSPTSILPFTLHTSAESL